MLRVVYSLRVACLWTVASCGLAAFVPSCSAAEPSPIKPEQLLTNSTAVFVRVTPPREYFDLLAGDGSAEHVISDYVDQIEPLRKALESNNFAKFKAVLEHLERKLDTTWRDALPKLVGGGVTAAFDTSDQALLVFVQTTDQELLLGLHDELISLVEADAEAKGNPSPVKSQEYNGQTGYTFGKDEAHVLLDDMLVVSNKADALRAIVDRRAALLADEQSSSRSKKSLADDPAFQAALKHASPGDAAFGFVRVAPLRLLTGFSKAFGSVQKAQNVVGEILAGGMLGALETADYVAATVRVGDSGLQVAAHLKHDRDKTAAGRMWFFSAKPGQSAGAPLAVPGKIATLTAYRDVGGMWVARNELFDEKTNVGLTQADTNLGLYFSGRDFGSQVLGELEPRWQFVAAQREYGRDGEPVPALKLPGFALVWELKNPESFGPHLQMAFQNIIGITNIDGAQKGRPQLLLRTEQRGDAEIHYGTYLLVEEIDRNFGPIHFNFRPACARVGKYFVVGTHVDLVRHLADRLGKQSSTPTTDDSLALDVDFGELAKILEANRAMIVGRQMLAEGGDRPQAQRQLDLGLEALKLLEGASLRLVDGEQAMTLEATFRTLAK